MHKIIVGVTSVLLLCGLGVTRGQNTNGDKNPSNPAFKVLNGSRANPRITLTELLDSYETAVGGKEAIDKIRTIISHQEGHATIEFGQTSY